MGLGLGVFLVFPWFLHVSSAGTHTLQYLKTSVRGINPPEFTAVDQVDGEQIVYYNSSIRKMSPKTEWIKKINADDPGYWAERTEEHWRQQHWFNITVDDIMQRFNHTKGVHTLQLMYGCELSDDNKTRGYRQFGYDGEDFVSLDLKTGSWTGTRHQAKIIKLKWESGEEERPEHWKSYLEKECIVWLKKFVSYGRDALERKVGPEASVFQKHSSSPEVVCHATGFFPKAVTISWQKDGEDVYEDVEVRETLPNQDGSFQKRSVLKVPAEELQKHTYTCVIQHSSLEKDVVLSVSERRILRGGGSDSGSDGGSGGAPIALIVAVVSALVVAVVVVLVAGIVVWKKRNSGFKPVPPKPSSEGDSSSNNSSSVTVCLPAELRERDEEMEMRTGINGDLNGATTQTQLLPSMTPSVELCPDS